MIPTERAVQFAKAFIPEGVKSFCVSFQQLPVKGKEPFQAFFPGRWGQCLLDLYGYVSQFQQTIHNLHWLVAKFHRWGKILICNGKGAKGVAIEAAEAAFLHVRVHRCSALGAGQCRDLWFLAFRYFHHVLLLQ
jgi:hypothetical protein